jgi:hypothetical protein
MPGGTHALGRLVFKRQVDEPMQHRLHRPRDPRPDRLLDVLDHLERSDLADVLDCSIWLKYRSSTGGPPFLVLPTEGREPSAYVLPVDFHKIRDATRLSSPALVPRRRHTSWLPRLGAKARCPRRRRLRDLLALPPPGRAAIVGPRSTRIISVSHPSSDSFERAATIWKPLFRQLRGLNISPVTPMRMKMPHSDGIDGRRNPP